MSKVRWLIVVLAAAAAVGCCSGCASRAENSASTSRIIDCSMTDPTPYESSHFETRDYLQHDPF